MKKIVLISVTLLILPFELTANSILNPPWCEDNYAWQNKKGFDVLDRKLVSETILDKTEYSSTYSRQVIKFYSKSFSDNILEYTNYNGKKRYIVIEGMRVGKFYDFLTKTIVDSNVQLYKYLTCSKQFTELNPAEYKETKVDMMLPPNGKGTITRYGTEYAKIHNLALVLTYYMKSVTSISNYSTKDSDEFTQAYVQYFTELGSGEVGILFFKIKNAKDNYELLNIVFDEAFKILKVITTNPKYKHLQGAVNFGNKFKESYAKWVKTRDNDVYERHNVLKDIKKDVTKIFDDTAKKGLDALIKYTGLEGALKGTEGAVNFIIASAILTEMIQESNMQAHDFSVNFFKDVPYNNSNYSSIAIYSLLANESISSPKESRNYNFYPNESITAGELAIMLINELLYDEYMIYKSNLQYEPNKLYYLYSQVIGSPSGGGMNIKSSDLVNAKMIQMYLQYIFKYKILKISEKKYGENNIDNGKLNIILNRLANESFGIGKIDDVSIDRFITRVESARVVFSTKQYSWEDIAKSIYEGGEDVFYEKASKDKQYGSDTFYKKDISISNSTYMPILTF